MCAAFPYREYPAGERLAQWVECGWSVETSEALSGYSVSPDGCLDVIWSSAGGLRVVGAMTAQQRFDFAPGVRNVGVRFRPGMAAGVLHISAAELTDRTVPLTALCGPAARELESRLREAGPAAGGVRLLLDSIVPPVALSGVQRAIGAIAARSGLIGLETVARDANLSGRQFRRRCLEESGLTPKQLCRVLRFRRAYALAARSIRPDWAGIAAESGYCDQPHLIRDFREFTGAPPMSVFSNTGAPRLDIISA